MPIPYSGKVVNGDIGYVHLTGFASGDSLAVRSYADSLQSLIKRIDGPEIKGWIVDLRENTGGNCWPMLAGIGPILGDGVCGFFVSRDDKSSYHYNDGKSGGGEYTLVAISGEPYKVQTSRVAVLTGAQTASSGEVLVAAFHGRPNTRSFGMSTAGLSTGNARFSLSDGSMLLLTTSVYADRHGYKFGKEIPPDEWVEFSYESIGSENDPAIEKAAEWIRNGR
jgi:C-terminal processing protease CtpA/Prc